MYSVFYWLTRADSVKDFFDTTSNIFTWLCIISGIIYVILSVMNAVTISENKLKNEGEEKTDPDFRAVQIGRKYLARLFYTMLPLALITWTCWVFTPTKKDCMLIVAGGAVGNFITSDSSARSIPADITKFLHLSLNKEIDDLSKETQQDIKKELGIQTPKEKLLDKVANLTKDEIINYIKNDTTIAK